MRRQARFFLPLLCLVVLPASIGGQQPASTVNLRPRAVTPTPGVPPVRVTADRQRVPLGTQVTFTLAPASIATDRRYVVTLYFGDGQTQVMRAPQTTHLYRAVGNYTYAVDVKQAPPAPCTATVNLDASPTSLRERESVGFSAQLSGSCPNLQYRFVFGDGTLTGWQNNPQAQHQYARAGSYFPYVDISDGQNRIGGSKRTRIDVAPANVTPPDRVSVSLSARPLPARSGRLFAFTAKSSPARPDARYLFNFGDGNSTAWQSQPQAQHAYSSRGRYNAYVQVSQSINNQNVTATSAPVLMNVRGDNDPTPNPRPSPTVTPTPDPRSSPTPDPAPTPSDSATPDGPPTPNPSPTGTDGGSLTVIGTPSPTPVEAPRGNTWWYLLIAAVILFLIYQATGYLFAAKPTFAPFADPGVAAVAHEKGALPINFELVLDPNVSGGDYSVTTDQPRLVTNAPPEDRQILEI